MKQAPILFQELLQLLLTVIRQKEIELIYIDAILTKSSQLN